MNGDTQKWKPLPKASGQSVGEIEAQGSRIQELERREALLRVDFDRLERRSDKSANFMMMLTGAIAIATFIALALVTVDYFKNNNERYEKSTTEIGAVRKELNEKYYTKEEVNRFFNADEDISKIISCIRSKGSISMGCFKI
jgi:replicative DNA helicase